MPSVRDIMSIELDILTPNAVLTVSRLNRMTRELLESSLPLLWVTGEVSNLLSAASGHVYFSLKDESAQARCIMFRNRAQLLPFRLANGMRLEVRALATLYEPRGDFQLTVETARRAGIGALYEAFERLKARLSSEGLFDAARRRPLPHYPRRIGVITSPRAAALRDVLITLKRRSPHVPVMIYPTLVQGADAPASLVAALLQANERADCDVLILARGGGSIEDLWAFNDEAVARAISACSVPLVSGIGHETDTTIADFVADQRAATPTAAAELVSAGYVAARQALVQHAAHLRRGARRMLERSMQRVDLLARRLVHPGERIRAMSLTLAHLASRMRASWRSQQQARRHDLAQARLRLLAARPRVAVAAQRLSVLENRLPLAMSGTLQRSKQRLAAASTSLSHLDPAAALKRGYAIARTAGGMIVRSGAGLAKGETLRLQFGEGWAESIVTRSGR